MRLLRSATWDVNMKLQEGICRCKAFPQRSITTFNVETLSHTYF